VNACWHIKQDSRVSQISIDNINNLVCVKIGRTLQVWAHKHIKKKKTCNDGFVCFFLTGYNFSVQEFREKNF